MPPDVHRVLVTEPEPWAGSYVEFHVYEDGRTIAVCQTHDDAKRVELALTKLAAAVVPKP